MNNASAAEFTVLSGDAEDLIAAIEEANANGETDTIHLQAGSYGLTETLPSISSPITIRGAGAQFTTIEPAAFTVENGSFESGDFANWQILGDASIQNGNFGIQPTQGAVSALITTINQNGGGAGGDDEPPLSGTNAAPSNDVFPFLEIVVDDLGGIVPPGAAFPVFGSGIRQTLSRELNDSVYIAFDYSFLTDNEIEEDIALVIIRNESTGTTFITTLKDPPDLALVPSSTPFAKQTAVQRFRYETLEPGIFTLEFVVWDVAEGSVKSGLLIDNVRLVPTSLTFGFGSIIQVTEAGHLELHGVALRGSSGGGAIKNEGNLTMIGSSVLDSSGRIGGGIVNTGTMTISHSTVRGNNGEDAAGGVYTNGTMKIFNTVIDNNTAGGDGAGILNEGGELTISRSTILENGTVSVDGGGISNLSGIAYVLESTISDNYASEGGGIYSGSGTIALNSTTVSGNTAEVTGGGIALAGSDAQLTAVNTTISNNSVSGGPGMLPQGEGGGIANNSSAGTVSITNSTIAYNSASGGGGLSSLSGKTTVENSILAHSMPGDCDSSPLSLITSLGHNIVSDLSCEFFTEVGDLVNTDPLIGPLQDNGGAALTHALLADSPAIDAGANARCPASDQRRAVRPQDGDSDNLAVCDIGSYEVGLPGDLDLDGDVDRDDIITLMLERNTDADGFNDPRDLDGDGRITVIDARRLVLLCTRPRCATL
jgi:hypothetical protein